MKSLLPIIFVILLLAGAITYTLTKNTLTKVVPKQEGVPATELEVNIPSPTPSVTTTKTEVAVLTDQKPKVTPTPTIAIPTLTLKPASTEAVAPVDTVETTTTKGGEEIIVKSEPVKTVKTTKTTVCTPVYGMANTCTEHVVVDTAGESSFAFNLAGLSYLLGLAAFVKSKFA